MSGLKDIFLNVTIILMSGKAIPFANLVDLKQSQGETWELKLSNVLRAQSKVFDSETYKIEPPVLFEDDVSFL